MPSSRQVMMTYFVNFGRIGTPEALLDALSISQSHYEMIVNFIPPPRVEKEVAVSGSVIVAKIPVFIRHDIPKRKKGRGYRTAWEPLLRPNPFKPLARRLENYFRMTLAGYPHPNSYGYHPGRNIKENAGAHAGHKHVLSTDISDFFPSIKIDRVTEIFEATDIRPEIAEMLARFVTIGGTLPLGLPTSPTISNVVLLQLDQELTRIAENEGATYTRYSDDICFSSNVALPDIDDVSRTISEFGFAVADHKTRRSKIGQAHFVTGLSVSDPSRPHVPKYKKRKLRQELYYAGKFGLAGHFNRVGINDENVVQEEVNRLDGTVKFVAHHEPEIATALKRLWRSILVENEMKVSYAPRGLHREAFFLMIDEAEVTREGEKVLALCIAATQHFPKIADETNELLLRTISDVYADGNIDVLCKKGMHFSDATQDLRLKYVQRLEKMPYEAYVAYQKMVDPTVYEGTYLALLNALIRRRLMAAESKFCHLYIEENSKVSSTAIRKTISDAYDLLKSTNNRRPLHIAINFISKPNPASSVPDFLLGVLGRYLNSEPFISGRPPSRDHIMFERLRDKLKLIHDLDQNVEYSRRKPIRPWSEVSK